MTQPHEPPAVSIIIPVYRDVAALARVLAALHSRVPLPAAQTEVIVASTTDDAEALRAIKDRYRDVIWVEAVRGRATQMNAAAARASGVWLLFLHADTMLDEGWMSAIEEAARDPDVALGCFRFVLDSTKRFARVLERGVSWRVRLLKLPYGDQALFVRSTLFREIGGYAEVPIMEDVDLVRRALRHGRLHASPRPATTSSRLWEERGWLGTTARHLGLITLYGLGVSPARLARLARTRHL